MVPKAEESHAQKNEEGSCTDPGTPDNSVPQEGRLVRQGGAPVKAKVWQALDRQGGERWELVLWPQRPSHCRPSTSASTSPPPALDDILLNSRVEIFL